MTNRTTLEALLARVLEGTGPDRELDAEIDLYLLDAGIRAERFSIPFDAPPYTTSLDAALALVPEGWGWAISTTGDLVPCAYGHSPDRSFWVDDTKAATPARAVCAFALRARIWIALQISGGKDEPLGN